MKTKWLVLVAILGIVVVPLADPAFAGLGPKPEKDGGIADADDGAGDPVEPCKCLPTDPDCDDDCTDDPPLSASTIVEVPGTISGPTSGEAPGWPGRGTAHASDMDAGGYFGPGGATPYEAQTWYQPGSDLNYPIFVYHEDDANTLPPACIEMSEETWEIGGIRLELENTTTKVAQIFKLGVGAGAGEVPSGVTRTAAPQVGVVVVLRVYYDVPLGLFDKYTFEIPTEPRMTVLDVNEKIRSAIDDEFNITDYGDFWIVGPHLWTGRYPFSVTLQVADDGFDTMRVALRSLGVNYFIRCANEPTMGHGFGF